MDPVGQESGGYRFGNVEVDVRRHRVRRDGVDLPLEPKAHAVLVTLLRHAGDVVGRDALLDAVWGHRHVTPAVLNRVIALLRRELGDSADHPRLIRTVHGVGYAFIGSVEQEPCTAAPASPEVASVPAPASQAPIVERRQVATPVFAAARPRYRLLAALAVLAIVAAAVLAWLPVLRTRGTAEPAAGALPVRSVAVLPLVDVGGDASRQFLADGLSENLITTLSQYKDLKVIGRGSSFLFRGGKEDARTIGVKLGVAHLIEGSVQRVGDDVRVSIELIRSADGSTVWTRRFDRPYKALFALQDEIALTVAGALQVNVLHAMPSMVETGRPASGNLEAYEVYLRATAEMSASGNRGAKAIEYFTQATRIDPAYAQAWSWLGLARTLNARTNPDREAARKGLEQARAEIDTALRLQPNFGQAHAIRANWLRLAKRDWDGALAEFRIALPLVPDNDPSHGALSLLLATLGRVDEATTERRKYIDGDPLAAFARIYLAELLASRGRLDEAEASLRDANELDIHPESSTRDWRISRRAYLAILRGNTATALAEVDTMRAGRSRERWRALALQIGTDRPAADAALQRLIDDDERAGDDAYTVARTYALRGDADRVFEWVQRDMDRGGVAVDYVLYDPFVLRFRNDARFAALCTGAGLPPPTASEALDIDRIRRMHVLVAGSQGN